VVKVKCYPVLPIQHLMPLSDSATNRLPDIIDLYIGKKRIALYFYPITDWCWQLFVIKDKQESVEIFLPTVTITCL
jgi:hypothetical protein